MQANYRLQLAARIFLAERPQLKRSVGRTETRYERASLKGQVLTREMVSYMIPT